jgi:hypothetical protein
MKTRSSAHPVAKRILHGVIAICCIAAAPVASAAKPLGKVPVSLNGQVLGNRMNISVNSGNKRIVPSQLYSYVISGRVRGKKGTPAAAVVPAGTAIPAFLESLSPGSSKFLKGSFSNSSGKLPVTVLDRKIRGSRNVAGLGKVTVSFNLLATIDVDGVCQLEITKVKFKSSRVKNLGAIEYMTGSKIQVSAAPEITFAKTATAVSEDAGSVTVEIRRTINRHGSVSVNYSTVTGTADSSDFTATSGTITFAPNEISKSISIPIIDNALTDANRRFSVELSNPSSGAFLDPFSSMNVVILDDE